MATNQPLPDREPPPAASEAASQQLAAALRRNRLTLLCGAPGAGKSALLAKGVLPQLRRRGGDAAVSVARRPLEAVLPFPERRARDDASPAELAVFVNDWRAASQASLHDGIDAALRICGIDPEWHREPLTERVQSLSSRFGTRFLFVLDGFETVLDAPVDDDRLAARDELLGEIVHLLNKPVPANLLIALRADAEVRLSPLLERLHAVRPEVLMLEGGRTRRVYGPAKAVATPAVPEKSPPASAAKPKPTQLSQFDSARMPEAANTGAPTRPGDIGRGAASPTVPAATARRARPTLMGPAEPALAAPPEPPQRRALTKRRLVVIASIALAALAGGALLFRAALPGENDAQLHAAAPAETIAATLPAAPAVPAPSPVPTPAAPAEMPPAATAAAPTPAVAPPPESAIPTAPPLATAAALPTAPPRPRFALRVDADNAATRLPRELAQALASGGFADLQIVPTPLALPAAGGRTGSPGLAIVRYDALQAAARGTTKPDLAVVAPLYTEELQIVVRADSKLQFIHQIDGRRVNVGAAQGARALTARALYRQMFDKPLPSTPQGQLDAAPALQRLIAGDGIDAVVLVGPQPAAALAALAPAQRRDLKLLALDPANAASRRALQSYLPAMLREPAGATTPTLAAMSFLVTTGGAPDAEATRTLARLASSLCSQLPELQRDGDAKWRELRAGLQLDTGLPPAGAADAAWRACAGAASPSTLTSTRN